MSMSRALVFHPAAQSPRGKDAASAAEKKKASDKAKDYMNLEEDVYCNLMLRLIEWHELDPPEEGDEEPSHVRRSRVIHGVILYCANLLFQFMIICLVLLAAEQKAHPLKDMTFIAEYGHTRAEATAALNNAVAAEVATLPDWFSVALQHLCGNQMTAAFLSTTACMTLLWVMVMVGECKSILWWVIFIVNVPAPTPAPDSDEESEDYDYDGSEIWSMIRPCDPSTPKIVIHALTRPMKALLLLIVPSVRIFLAGVLMVAGVKFIFVQTDLANTVLKVMTLKFVMAIDNVLMKALGTKYSDRQLGAAKIYSPGSRTKCCGSSFLSLHWESLGGMVWMLVGIIIWALIFWLPFGQQFLFRRACLQYHQAFGGFGVRENYSVFGAMASMFHDD